MQEPQYHIHIGAHDVYPTLLQELTKQTASAILDNGTYVVPASEFQEYVRPQILGKNTALQAAPIQLEIPAGVERVVISAHGLLCGPNQIMTAQGLYANSQQTIAGLQGYFSDKPVTLHLLTPPQHDYGPIVAAQSEADWPMSWAPLVHELLAALPHAEITLWPIEIIEDVVSFCESILDVPLGTMRPNLIEQTAAKQRRYKKADASKVSDPLSLRLDSAFAVDMEHFSELDRVSIGVKRIRDEFLLS